MLPNRIELAPGALKKNWSANEIEDVKRKIEQYFAETADWDHSVADMGLTYQIRSDGAVLGVAGDFYLDEGVRIIAFGLARNGDVILLGEEDEENRTVCYVL